MILEFEKYFNDLSCYLWSQKTLRKSIMKSGNQNKRTVRTKRSVQDDTHTKQDNIEVKNIKKHGR